MADPGYGQFVINNRTFVRTPFVTITVDPVETDSAYPSRTSISLATEEYILHFGFDEAWEQLAPGDSCIILWMTLEKLNAGQYYYLTNYENVHYFTITALDRDRRTLSGTFQAEPLRKEYMWPPPSVETFQIGNGSFNDIPYDYEPATLHCSVTIGEKPDFITPNVENQDFFGRLDLEKGVVRLWYSSNPWEGLELIIKARPVDIFSNIAGVYTLNDTSSLNSARGKFAKFGNNGLDTWNLLTTEQTGGTLEITHHDVVHQRISGTFRMKISVDSTTVPIELEGRFDSLKLSYNFSTPF